MVTIIHVHPDLDACACVAFAGASFDQVHFWPSQLGEVPEVCPCCGQETALWDPTPWVCPGCGSREEGLVSVCEQCERPLHLSPRVRILDHPLGQKGRLDPDGTRHAAAVDMEEACEAVGADPMDSTYNTGSDLLAEIDELDSTGRVLRPRFSLGAIVAAFRRDARGRGLSGGALDRAVLASVVPMVRGLALAERDRQEAGRTVVDTVELPDGVRLAVLPPGPTSPELGKVLERAGYVGAIYHDDWNLGVVRYPGQERPDLRKLEPYLPGWFVHTAGFLACWGSRKAPAEGPPPNGTPQDQAELADLLRQVATSWWEQPS